MARICILLVLVIVFFFLAATFIYQASVRPQEYYLKGDSSGIQRRSLESKRPLYISALETRGFHDEVLAALIHSFGHLPGSQFQFFQRNSRYRMHDIMRTFDLENRLPDVRNLNDFMSWNDSMQQWPDIVISTTCELDMLEFKNKMTVLLKKHHTYVFCVIHEPNKWRMERESLEETVSDWIRKDRIDFLTLSPHTRDFLIQYSLNKWKVVEEEGYQPRVRHFTPVFPVQLPAAHEGENPGFALQGAFEQERRNYSMTFTKLSELLYPSGRKPGWKVNGITKVKQGLPLTSVPYYRGQQPPPAAKDQSVTAAVDQSAQCPAQPPAATSSALAISQSEDQVQKKQQNDEAEQTTYKMMLPNIILHLVGYGAHPKVPTIIRKNVVFDEGLNYIDFYTVLSRQFALLPAFTTTEYVDRKASSTVPASLIAGVPLVATQQILNSYTYLKKEIVWFQDADETDFNVIERILKMSHEARKEKAALVRAHTKHIIEENTKLIRQWAEEALSIVGIRVNDV